MKKAFIAIALTGLAATGCSNKHDYTCTCTYNLDTVTKTVSVGVHDTYDRANGYCQGEQFILENDTVNIATNVHCSL